MCPVLINGGLYDYRLVWFVRDGRVITPEKKTEKKTVLFSADSERREKKISNRNRLFDII
jgi:hypothetical protein